MANAPARLYIGQPGTGATTLYTVSATAGSYVLVKEILVVNTTATAATITLGINGVAAANQILPGLSIAATTVVDLSQFNTVLNASDTLQALQGTASALTVIVSGVTGP